MDNFLPAGKYVVAVSGGVDSAVLLHMLQADPSLELVVAHFDHGIRSDSADDAAFAAGLAEVYGLRCVAGVAKLGPHTSEDVARKHRYAFLEETLAMSGALAIVTAHHQDDVIETALINLMRGTRRRGFVSLQSTDAVRRPLLAMTKQQVHGYALKHRLEWREDSTNQSMDYLRNRIRTQLYQNLDSEKRTTIVALLDTISSYNLKIEAVVNGILINHEKNLPRNYLKEPDAPVAGEIAAGWLRNNRSTFDKKTIGRLVAGAKELRNGSKIDINKQYYCLLTKHEIVLSERESV